MYSEKFVAACMVFSLLGVPAISFAKAGGRSGSGYAGAYRGNGSSGSIGSRGSRTSDQNGAKPIQQPNRPKPPTTPAQSAAGSPAPTGQPAPATQPSMLQRNPLLAGIAGGLAGSWIVHMWFGAADSSARTTEPGEHGDEPAAATGASSGTGILLLLLLLIAGAFYYFMKARRSPTPDFSGITRSSTVSESLPTGSSIAALGTITRDVEVTTADKSAFQQLLIDIQTAWSNQDLQGLRRLVTPDILTYFSTALAEHTSQGIENHVEDVVLLHAEVRESWTEGEKHYATVELHWSARDYTLSMTKPRGEQGHLVEGNEEKATESGEIWTFMRHQKGKWLLSAIQQINS